MLVNSLLLTATAAISLLPSLVYAAPAPAVVYHEDGSVELVVDSTDDDGNVVAKRNVFLESFTGCSKDQEASIVGSWRSMLEMAAKIKDKVDFNEQVAKDFLGDPSRNKDDQDMIKKLINSVGTWQLGGRINWHLQMQCDDPNRKKKQRGASFPDGCPTGAKKEDFEKCASRCWRSAGTGDNGEVIWRKRAIAYTENWPSTHVGMMNWCPGWFDQPTCNSAASKWSRASDANKFNMINYQCREQSMVHELFHIDANWKHHAYGNGHIMDRSMYLENPNGGPKLKRQAYGPLYTKVLARYGLKSVGLYVRTNADNLAFYFLGKWIQEEFGVYPNEPITDKRPIGFDKAPQHKRDDGMPDETPDVWDPIREVDGKVELGDPNDLAQALGAESKEDAYTLYEDNPDACLDFVAQDENDENPVCVDIGEVVELEADQAPVAGPVDAPTAGPVVAPTASPAAAPAAGPVTETRTGEVATSCVYTVTTIEGVTEPGVYTLEPTVETMCLCNDVIQAGIATVTAEDNSRYLVCQVENQITVSTLPPEEPTPEPESPGEETKSEDQPPEPTPQDPESPDCKACSDNMGASSCPAEDQQCLIDQCRNDEACQRCVFDCDGMFQ
ncbi:hypothetical protein NCS52_01575900 [Fusarium sp. LHS14.1]|nr:hypothetical protein NCS52_01575900 [Fusarium sp. LHS14.1]